MDFCCLRGLRITIAVCSWTCKTILENFVCWYTINVKIVSKTISSCKNYFCNERWRKMICCKYTRNYDFVVLNQTLKMYRTYILNTYVHIYDHLCQHFLILNIYINYVGKRIKGGLFSNNKPHHLFDI